MEAPGLGWSSLGISLCFEKDFRKGKSEAIVINSLECSKIKDHSY